MNVATKPTAAGAAPDVVETVAAYFRSAHWNEVMEALQIDSEPVYHLHAYIETQIHPMSLEEIVKGYFARIGRPVHRKIEIFTSGQVADSGSIHGIEPQGLPHFDLLWKYSPDALIKPAARADNVEWWGASYMKEFYARYPFVTEMTPDAQKQVDAYFAGPAWARYCDLNEHRDVVHIHANVETSLHPDLILKPALAAMKKRGWDIHEVVPVAFQMRGQMHGKLVFIADKPEKIFDIAWCFNPTVALIPSTRYWLTTEDPTYDARTMAELPLLLKRDPYRLLSLAEVEAVVEAI
ncbi:hypothetical protein LA66_05135 [Aureimonas altamirensis]|uniref:Uncharacterized protein n=1 Tax=Aureimonas altamirensis TaxID=370622 RepID=A0A0B1QAR5_9HYPH|nr:hypothetical protein [Aureimonas altamirensis]KHJ56002.1 hypothetical protein LA66_05135 [Aureimonas altamirensis]